MIDPDETKKLSGAPDRDADPPTMPIQQGSSAVKGAMLGQFEIIELLGSGGFGEVYRARDTRLGRSVAVKILPETVARDPERLERFRREAMAASALNHPNICTVHDLVEAEGHYLIAMELVEGRTLHAALSNGPLPLAETLAIAMQIADALAEAHRAGIIHRDIKAGNVIVTPRGRAKVLDFGLAKRIAGESSPEIPIPDTLTGEGMALGTLSYMAPEQLLGGSVDQRSDLFSFGVLLYEMVTGRRPFRGSTAVATVDAILHKPPTDFGDATLPAGLTRLILRLLEKEPARRPPDAHAVMKELETLAASVADGKVPRVSRRSLLALAAVCLVVATIAGWLWQRTSSERRAGETTKPSVAQKESPSSPSETKQRTIAVMPIENPDPKTAYLSDGIAEGIIDGLSTSSAIRVTSRTSSFRYRGGAIDPRTAGRELGATAIVTGRFEQRASECTLRLELVDTRDGSQLWSKDYRQRTEDLETLRARAVGDLALRLGVSNGDTPRLVRNAEAYDLFLRGRYHWSRRTLEEQLRAVECFQRATALDPDFAPAWAGLASVYGTLVGNSMLPGQEEEIQLKSIEAAKRAIDLDPSNAEAWASLAASKLNHYLAYEEAERDFQHAIRINPSVSITHVWYALLLIRLGRFEESARETDIAMQLDPFSTASNNSKCHSLMLARKYDEALSIVRAARERDPEMNLTECATWSSLLRGNVRGAAEELSSRSPETTAAFAKLSADAGTYEFLRTYLAFLPESQHYLRGASHAMLGERDAAFAELERAFTRNRADVGFLGIDPRLDSVRDDPRYLDLALRLKLPQAKRAVGDRSAQAPVASSAEAK